jgi:uncharacterized phage protein (TIGR01671 family)
MEIKFRGLRTDGKGWVYGEKLTIGNYVFIVPFNENINEFIVGFDKDNNMPIVNLKFEVKPESVGQFTGLRDKDGVEIYVGDVIIDGSSEVNKKKFVVVFNASHKISEYVLQEIGVPYLTSFQSLWSLKIIGNIHENPELLTK